MPILCHCPNGHALRVKDKLAGKTGVCPKCQAEFTVVGTPVPTAEPAVATAPGSSATESSTATEPSTPQPESPAPSDPPESQAPPSPPTALEWRVADPTGTQFGPVTPGGLAEWIDEGRVQGDWHVWRSDWPEWRLVSEASGELPAELPKAPAPSPPPAPASGAATRPTTRARSEDPPSVADAAYARRRVRSAKRKRVVIALMAVVCLTLGGTLIWLLFFR